MEELYENELAVAEAAARAAGATLIRRADEGIRFGLKPSTAQGLELVSEADIEADSVLHTAILDAFPDDGWLSEEFPDDRRRLEHSRVWIVDPLDGTREFLSQVPEYAVSVGLVVDGVPVLGAVYNPAKEKMTAAVVGGPTDGALDAASSFQEAVVLVGRGEWRVGSLPPLPAGTRVLPVGSIAFRMALLSQGMGSLIFTVSDRNEWDVAAGVALLLAAGATVTDLDGQPLQFNKRVPYVPGCIAGNAALHAEALRHWERHGWL